MLDDQLGGGFRTDAGNAGNIVHAVAHQREDVADQFGANPEFLRDPRDPDAYVLHRVEHVDMRCALGFADQLHQILVRRNDGHIPPRRHRRLGICRNQIVGLEPGELDAGQ